MKNILYKGRYLLMLALQIIVVVLTGVLSKDLWYIILISTVGIGFNMLVSIKKSYGFLLGFVYAIANGIIAYFSGIYATFAFMIFLQAPMAIYSYLSWKKNVSSAKPLKIMRPKEIVILIVAMAALGVIMYFVLKWLRSNNVLLDTIFFVFSVSACLLLAMRYKNAYIITLLSGIGGTIMWAYQMALTKGGLSLSAFYLIVVINSIIAICMNYKKLAIQPINKNDIVNDNISE